MAKPIAPTSAKAEKTKKIFRTRVEKRTSQGTYDKPKNKHARKNFKLYRGQGRP
jgi:stalled ribosome alternative rescue factor ArfA